MSQFPDADEPLDDFISSLAQSAGIEGWTLVRFQTSHTDRSYELRGDHRVAPFTAKVSLTEKPFWGLTESKAQHIRSVETRASTSVGRRRQGILYKYGRVSAALAEVQSDT
jgi:hypothetical protein